ncbi:hypothetical protein L204_104231 [Cryptococcus depauperatus]
MSEEQLPFFVYILERLKQAGVKQIFGVPGDFTLAALDYIESDPELEWVGNANELNAAYASDGYARVKRTLAVVITTFGVGEFGIAGCLAERVPVLHIVGAPSIQMQAKQSLLHHTLNTPDSFSTFSTMSAHLSCSQALINVIEPKTSTTWTEAFDKTLKAVLEQCRPGYVEVPTDAVHAKVSAEGLKQKLPDPNSAPPAWSVATSLSNTDASAAAKQSAQLNLSTSPTDVRSAPPSDEVTAHVVEDIAQRYIAAKKPIVIVDACAGRFGMAGEVRRLVDACAIRFFETPMGKSLMDERHPLYGGCYAGANSLPAVKEEVESADFVLYVGALKSDFNSGSFSVNIDPKVIIELHSFTTTIGYAAYPTTDIRHVLPLLGPAFKKLGKPKGGEGVRDTLEQMQEQKRAISAVPKPEGNEIKHSWLWPRVGAWFKDDDIIITETGTSSFGLTNIILPSHCTYVSQILWGSIGWSVGACLGAAMAAKEDGKGRRTALFVGDGSLQLTLQEIGTMLRRNVHSYIFVLNNDGYEIERQIHGWNAEYNNIQPYDHQLLLPFLAGKKCKTPYQSYKVHTPEELNKLLDDEEFNVPDRLRLIEVYMPRGDAPEGLVRQAKLTSEANDRLS